MDISKYEYEPCFKYGRYSAAVAIWCSCSKYLHLLAHLIRCYGILVRFDARLCIFKSESPADCDLNVVIRFLGV